jgi:hypothetical protein
VLKDERQLSVAVQDVVEANDVAVVQLLKTSTAGINATLANFGNSDKF